MLNPVKSTSPSAHMHQFPALQGVREEERPERLGRFDRYLHAQCRKRGGKGGGMQTQAPLAIRLCKIKRAIIHHLEIYRVRAEFIPQLLDRRAHAHNRVASVPQTHTYTSARMRRRDAQGEWGRPKPFPPFAPGFLVPLTNGGGGFSS
jgi:hypothetical protein